MPGARLRPTFPATGPLMLRLALVLLLLFVLFIAATRLLPQTSPSLDQFDRLFTRSSACDTPCLMGIRPGMPLQDAIALLRNHDWVLGQTAPNVFQSETEVVWNWSGQQPDFIDSSSPGYLYARSYRGDTSHVVYRIEVATDLPFQALQAALGSQTDAVALYWPGEDLITYELSYFNEAAQTNVRIRTMLDCPAWLTHFAALDRTWISHNEGQPLQRAAAPQDLYRLCRRSESDN